MQQNEFAFADEEIKNNIKEISDWYEKIKDSTPEEMSGFFTARLEGYEEHMKACFDEYVILPSFLPEDAETLLDLGCGTGLELDEIFKIYPDIEVTGIDITQPMLDELKRKHEGRNIKTVFADYFRYDFGGECFDAIISVQSLHHLKYDKKGEMYRKIFRALKPGGIYIEADYTASSEAHEKLCLDFYDRQRARFNIADDVFVHIDIPLTLEHRKELALSSGFRRIKTVHRADNTVTTVAYK